MEQVKRIDNESDYTVVMAKIDSLMAKGSENVSKEELAEIRALALAAQNYEEQKYVIAAPSTLTGMIEMRMYEMRLKQKDLAKKLNISDAKLSLIMNGKQRPDVDFLKAVHTELHVDAGFILQHV
jgi:HTH-type transcriptional regulator/antitoxin HigA